MSGEDQERFEDYLELERYIEELQAGHAAHPPTSLTPSQTRIYRMAALFRSAPPEAAEPRPAFAEELRQRLLLLDQDEADEDTIKLSVVKKPERSVPPPAQTQEPVVPQPAPPVQPARAPKKVRFVSRRNLLTGGAAVAASLLAGAGVEHIVEQSHHETRVVTNPTPPYTSTPYLDTTPLIGAGVPTKSFPVATVAELEKGAVKFVAESIVGYVIRNDHDDGETSKDPVIAMSAACTHMGCIVQWSNADRQYHCPCHGGIFTEYGKPSAGAPLRYSASLPRLKAYIQDNTVFVEVPM